MAMSLLSIVIGLIAAYAYNKFSETELPLALSFFLVVNV